MYGGIFLRKSICIKTNNKNISNYLLKELEYFDFKDIYVSCYDFKFYTNVIIHYIGKDVSLFLNKISTLLSYTIIDCYEPIVIKNMINLNYFYFSREEKQKIFVLCRDSVDFSNSLSAINIISHSFYEYFLENKYVILDGFVAFKLNPYIKELDSIVDMCVNKFIIDREYHDFINLLKTYIQTTPSDSTIVHLIYKNPEPLLLDVDKNVIKFNEDFINKKYLSDISFSSNDYILNLLLTLLPQKLYIHLLSDEDDFITTLKLIFDNRVYICTDCDLCNLYKFHKTTLRKNMNIKIKILIHSVFVLF